MEEKFTQKQFDENKDALERAGLTVNGPVWDEHPFSAEIECYTPAGEDMFILLEQLDREHMDEYIEDFDINEQVCGWWPGGHKAEGMGVPFDNIKEHYEDYEAWLERLNKIADTLV